MSANASRSSPLRMIIAGGGVAALETLLALADLAGDRARVTVLAPNTEFAYRPEAVREPFSYGAVRRYPLAPIVAGAGAELLNGELAHVDPVAQRVHTTSGEEIPYDALMLALGARPSARFKHALTIDDRRMEETLRGLIQDVEAGYVKSLAFVSPGRIAWPLPLYELALMSAARAFDAGASLSITVIAPEDAPLAIFGAAASEAVAALLAHAGIELIAPGYAEIPSQGEIIVHPGDRALRVDRAIALPELFGPAVRGIPVGENGFIHVDSHGHVPGAGPIFAAGDATEFAVKHGGIAAQQALAAAQSIAALAGADVALTPFHPVVEGTLLTGAKALHIRAQLTGGQGFSSEVSEVAAEDVRRKIAAKYLSPLLESYDRDDAPAR
jgi:sulfide:quinone oxidoreductase